MKRVLFSMVLLLVASFTFAQEKNVKEAKSIANGVNPDFAKAEELINQALTNPETKDNAETWDVAGLIQRKRSEKEMENANSGYAVYGGIFSPDRKAGQPSNIGMTVTYDINGSRIGSSVTTEGNITQEEREA